MTVLGLETATTVCGAALADETRVIADAWVDERNIHAEKLLLQVDRVLTQSGTNVRMLDGIAVSIGPGSFTGLRIGLSAAKGLAYAHAIPLLAVPTLAAIAARVMETPPPGPPGRVLALLDARRDEVYAQLFEAGTGEPVWDVRAMRVDDLLRELGSGNIVVTGDAREKVRAAVASRSDGKGLRFADDATARCSAAMVARIGVKLLRAGKQVEAGELEPQYLKDFFFHTR